MNLPRDSNRRVNAMEVLLTGTFMTALIAGTIAVAVPLLLAGLGEQISERAGVLNLGLEGMMLVGAFVGFAVTLATGSFAVGFLVGATGGVATAAIMGVMCVVLRLNQIVIGIAITLAMQGTTSLSHHVLSRATFRGCRASRNWRCRCSPISPSWGQACFARTRWFTLRSDWFLFSVGCSAARISGSIYLPQERSLPPLTSRA
jgi:general nucleoside transport system permease protein